jgi:hypothetical protein
MQCSVVLAGIMQCRVGWGWFCEVHIADIQYGVISWSAELDITFCLLASLDWARTPSNVSKPLTPPLSLSKQLVSNSPL